MNIASPHRWFAAAIFALSVGACAAGDTSSRALPRVHIDPARVTVAGLSAGAYMATQTHMAWPRLFSGAGLVAGGPYGCADGKLETALGSCMQGKPPIDVGTLLQRAEQRQHNGLLGARVGLAGDRIYVLHGRDDTKVAESVSRATATLYEDLRDSDPALARMQVTWDGQRAFGHNLPVVANGDDCAKSEAPFLGHCGFDAAGAIFEHLYGTPSHAATTAQGELRRFDQRAFVPADKDAFVADSGYVYLPKACTVGKPCGLMVVFHGCKQNADSVGEAFVREGGFNRWADAYGVAVLYPQTRASFAPLNPQACWDWWGYSGADYDTRNGVQQQWLLNALVALGMSDPRKH